jgi:replication factor C large subunit
MTDWTEKYRPSSLSELRGNDTARDQLHDWATQWPDDGRAIVLAGSPGVGKTSAALALAEDMGWEAVEVNASDSRTKGAIERLVGRASANEEIDAAARRARQELSGEEREDRTRQLLVVDEADSFHRADRGGSRALSEIVSETEQPMVLIVNDAYEMPDSLRRSLDAIDFRDISKRSIVPVLRDICRKEAIEFDDDALESLAAQNSGDLRGAIKDLQALAEGQERLTTEDVVTGERDTTRGIFDFLDLVIKEAGPQEALEASYAVDETPDDLVNWIEDNLPKDYHGEELVDAYGFLAAADRWLGRVRTTQNYTFWRYASDNMTAGVASARQESKGGWTRYGPPSYWSKLGRSRGARETRDYVARQMAATNGVSTGVARRELLPRLAVMTHHCKNRELTVAMAASYDLEAEHVAFVTGSGEDTNKVQSIIEEAQQLREEAAVAGSEGAFQGGETAAAEADESDATGDSTRDDTSGDGDDEEPAAEDDQQSGLSDFV